MIRRPVAHGIAVALVVALVTTFALAQPKPPGRHARGKAKAVDAGAPSHEAAPSAPAGESRTLDAGAIESKTLDGGTRVFRFGEVEIEGRLRNPQLVYFLRRVRAEFAAGDLGHRSFMRELSDTRHDPSF